MGIFERMEGSYIDDQTGELVERRQIDPHAMDCALFEHAVNHEYDGNLAPQATRSAIINSFDLRTDTGLTTYPGEGTFDEGPVSDQDDLDDIRTVYAAKQTFEDKMTYMMLVRSTSYLCHARVYPPSTGRKNLSANPTGP